MFTKTIKLLSLLLAACLTGSALAQSNTQSSQNSQQAAKTEPQFVDFTGFKGKVLEVKHREPRTLISILQPLGSGFKGAELKANSEFKIITVRDFPENIATIEEALKRLDVPMPTKVAETPKPDVEIYGYVLIASQGDATGSEYPKAIEDVVKQLQANLSFKNYRLLTPIVQRTKLGSLWVNSVGTSALPDKSITANYEFSIREVVSDDSANNSSIVLNTVELKFTGQNSPDGQNPGNAKLSTNLRIRDGEKVVVGTASLRDKALILVLTTKVLK
jgi:hypothetical protein